MIRTGDEYRESIRDGREVWMNGEKIEDVTTHPAFKPAVDARARIYDMQQRPECQETMTYIDEGTGERCAIALKLPMTRQDWRDKRRAVDAVLDAVGGVVTRVGDAVTVEMWSLYDGQDVLNEMTPTASVAVGLALRKMGD